MLPLRTRLRLELGETDAPVRFLVELQDSRAFWDTQKLFLSPAHINEVDFLQAQVQFNSDNFIGQGLASRFTIGRFTMDLGKRRLVARNGMRNTTNAFDGVLWTLGRVSEWKIRTFVTSPVNIKSKELDSSDPRRYFWGAYYEYLRFQKFRTELYYLGIHEDDDIAFRKRQSTLGMRIFKNPSPAAMNFEVESAWQFGKTGEQNHFSHLQHGELGYSLGSMWNPRLSFQYDYAEGDADPEDNKFGRFTGLFGARSFEYTPTGIYGPVFRSNLNSPGIRVVINPLKQLEIMASHRAFWLARAKDAWVGSLLVDPTGNSGKTLGQNFEIKVLWRPRDFFVMDFGYSRFFKGSYQDRVPGSPGTRDSNYFYIATEINAQLLPFR